MGVRWRIALDSLGISNGNALAPENTERATPAYKVVVVVVGPVACLEP